MTIIFKKQLFYSYSRSDLAARVQCMHDDIFNFLVPGVIDIAVIGQYVVWQRPIFPNGLIIGYSLQVVAGSQSRQIITVNATTFIYQVPSTNILSGGGNTYVQVCWCQLHYYIRGVVIAKLNVPI